MTRISLVILLEEHAALTRSLMKLADANAPSDAEYIMAIMMTDLAEIGRIPDQMYWPRPGEVPRLGWPIYKAVLKWCRAGMRLD